MRIRIIGTSHIAKQSIEEIKKAIEAEKETEKPDIIAVELDLQRASALLQQQKNKVPVSSIGEIGVKGYVFVKVGQFIQRKLGKIVGIAPGSEMKTAILLAKKYRLEVAFIDQPIQITLKNFSKELTWKEKGRFISDIFQGIFFPKKQMEKIGMDKIDLRKVPATHIISKLIKHLKERYPSIHKTLIEDRNKYMVKKLVHLQKENPDKKILAVVGAGHKEGMEKLLMKIDVAHEKDAVR
ncbi:MAG: TraB/GumN family protein [Nanoarchaeota archaeon]